LQEYIAILKGIDYDNFHKTMPDLKIAIGSDHAGYRLKDYISDFLKDKGYSTYDVGTYSEARVDYPTFAIKVAEELILKNVKYGILICGSGVGMSIIANRFPGIRAANCSDSYTAKMSRLHNNANILCLGERIIGEGLAKEIVEVFISTEFEGGRHSRRIELIEEIAIKYWQEFIGRI
jgi:ribose 5-phosphate isomerase B